MRPHPHFALSPLARACVLACSLSATGAPAQTLPGGGSIVQGSGSITSSGAAMTVTQGSARLVADWQSFSIGSGASVRFVQPSSSAVALNRVTGSDPSAIFGTLTANGHVYLQNPNGVLFAPGAQVDVGALVATTLQADLAEFMAGRLRLSGDPMSTATVRNEGRLSAAPGGHVVLAGPQVDNLGTIDAPFGSAALAAGSAVEIDATGAGLLSIRVPVAAVQARLAQAGTITADGGSVALQAAAVDAGLRSVMNVGGIVRARSIEQRDGQIVLSGGTSGVVSVDGTLDASGVRGGTIEVLGERVALTGTARLDATGDQGGGSVHVGGNLQGRGPLPNAAEAFVGRGAVLDASARSGGDGGTVVVWSDGTTRFAGEVRARGGAAGGDGGLAEVSGRRALVFDGTADLRAPAGAQGTLLLDPTSLSITDTGVPITGDVLFGDAPTAVTPASVAAVLANADLRLQADFALTVDSPLTVTTPRASTLTLNSAEIRFNAPTTLNNVALVADTLRDFSDGITIGANLQSLASITLRSTNVFIDDATVSAPQVNLQTPDLASSARIGQTSVASLQTDQLVVRSRTRDGQMTLDLADGGNRIGRLTLDTQDLGGTITNGAAGPMALDGTVDGRLSLQTNSPLTQVAALAVQGFAEIASQGAVTLTNAGNAFAQPLSLGAGGALSLVSGSDLVLSAAAGGSVDVQVAGLLRVVSSDSLITSPGLVTSAGDIEVRSAGLVLDPFTDRPIVAPAGSRYLLRSSDYTRDDLGALAFGAGADQVNHVVLGGWTGSLPAAGNTYVTNATGAITAPVADAPDLSRPYDRGDAITGWVQTGSSASATLQLAGGGVSDPTPLSGYTVRSAGRFDTAAAGVDKAYTIDASSDVTAVDAGSGVNYYGLGFAGFRRDAGPRAAGSGARVSEVTPLLVTLAGLRAVDRAYDGTDAVAIDLSNVTLAGVLAGDAVSAPGAVSGTVDGPNAGTNRPVGLDGLTLGGAASGNYVLAPVQATVNIAPRSLTVSGIAAQDRVADGSTAVTLLNLENASLIGVLPSDTVTLDARNAVGSVASPDPGAAKTVSVSNLVLVGGNGNYALDPVVLDASGQGLTVRILSTPQAAFDEVRYTRYLEGVSDAQEPFRRAMAEALASGFGKENIRKQLARGLVFETGLAAPAVDRIEPATPPQVCDAGPGLGCAR